ncbi:hypothetical protein EGR_08933 [Echinococcus granulosus]|uniref:Uncharacterized protein n=1 Tax=Echinococcus granulosus TaxID=6210 RepID=W6U4Z7_ECHGR|nr:hypothetical protein EGR_08933 [Echinococcus granulosus]EUB56185.1 hypothetical protein EGR_08933 [Echinococcus granulosus]
MRSLNATTMLEEEGKHLGKRDFLTTSLHLNANVIVRGRSGLVLSSSSSLSSPSLSHCLTCAQSVEATLDSLHLRSVFGCSLEGQHFELCWVR